MELPNKAHLRKSGIIFSILFLFLFSIIPYLLHKEIILLPVIFSFPLLFFSILSPYKLLKPYQLWIKFGNLLSKLNSKLVLSLFFYILISPFSILRKLIKFVLNRKNQKYSNIINIESESINLKDQY